MERKGEKTKDRIDQTKSSFKEKRDSSNIKANIKA